MFAPFLLQIGLLPLSCYNDALSNVKLSTVNFTYFSCSQMSLHLLQNLKLRKVNLSFFICTPQITTYFTRKICYWASVLLSKKVISRVSISKSFLKNLFSNHLSIERFLFVQVPIDWFYLSSNSIDFRILVCIPANIDLNEISGIKKEWYLHKVELIVKDLSWNEKIL